MMPENDTNTPTPQDSQEQIQNFQRESLVSKVFEHSDDIAKGILTNVKDKFHLLEERKSQIIVKRREICDGCPYMSRNATNAGWYSSIRLDEHCTVCGCKIEFKTACLDCNCGLEDFNKTHPENKVPLKWYADLPLDTEVEQPYE